MSFNRWFENKVERLAEAMETELHNPFGAVAAMAHGLGALASRLFGRAPEIDESPMELGLFGAADAVGENTSTSAAIEAEIIDYGAVSVAVGQIEVAAMAEAGPESASEFVFAEAESVIDGADFVLTYDITSSGENYATASHGFVAVDFDFVEADTTKTTSFDLDTVLTDRVDVAEGNVATAEFDVSVEGDPTLADVDVALVAIEDRFSASTLDAALAIG